MNGIGEFRNLVRPDLADHCPASNLALNEKIKKMIKEGRKVYHFGFGQAPFPLVDSAVDALREYVKETAYLPVAGIPELRQAICEFHQHHDKLQDLDPDRVIVGPGTKELIFLLMTVFNGDVLVVSPSWTTYKPQSQLAHHKPYTVTTDMENSWRITPEMVEKTILENNLTGNKLLILCNPCNPTGTEYTGTQLQALSKVFAKHNVIVLSDEIYGRLHYQHKHDTLMRYYPQGTILSSGLSKWASAGGWRLGYNIYPAELTPLMDAVKSAASNTYSCASAPIQYAAVKIFKDIEGSTDYMKHTARILKAVGDYCYDELTSIGVKALRSEAGYYFFPDFEILRAPLKKRGITTCAQMCEALFAEANVVLMSGGPAFLRPEDEFTTRFCYVCYDGGPGLKRSREIGLENPLPKSFVQEYATNAYDGVQALKSWILLQIKTYSD